MVFAALIRCLQTIGLQMGKFAVPRKGGIPEGPERTQEY